jgi:hypothetical protein
MAKDENTENGSSPCSSKSIQKSVVKNTQPIPTNDEEFEGTSEQQLVLSEQMSELSLLRSQNELAQPSPSNASNTHVFNINIVNGNGIHFGTKIVNSPFTTNQPSNTKEIQKTRTIKSRY